jgi:hypothetical protein
LARDLIRIQNKTNIIENGEVLIYSPIKFETIVIANLLPEVSNVINDDLVKAILRLRLQMITINNELEHYLRLDEERKKFQYEVHSECVINNVEESIILLM